MCLRFTWHKSEITEHLLEQLALEYALLDWLFSPIHKDIITILVVIIIIIH